MPPFRSIALPLGLGILGVALSLRPSAAEDAPAAQPLAFRDLAPRLAGLKDPLVLHVRLEADGRFGLRSARPAAKPAWVARGTWALGTDPKQQMESLQAFSLALRGTLVAEPRPDGLVEPDSYSAARFVIDAGPSVPWRSVQWVGSVASHGMLYRFSFLVPDTRWVDIVLPKDRGPVVPLEAGRLLQLSLTRPSAGGTGQVRTRLELTARDVRFMGTDLEVEEEIQGRPEPPPPPALLEPVDLPVEAQPSDTRVAAWRRIDEAVTKATEDARPWAVEVGSPPPTGAAVPAADVLEALALLSARKPRSIYIHGAPPPIPTRGWDFLR